MLWLLKKLLCLWGVLVWWILRVPNNFRGRISLFSQYRIRKGWVKLIRLAHRLNHLETRFTLLNLGCIFNQSALMVVDKRRGTVGGFDRRLLLWSGVDLTYFFWWGSCFLNKTCNSDRGSWASIWLLLMRCTYKITIICRFYELWDLLLMVSHCSISDSSSPSDFIWKHICKFSCFQGVTTMVHHHLRCLISYHGLLLFKHIVTLTHGLECLPWFREL